MDPVVNLDDLRKLCWSGIPGDLRPSIWRILLGIMPTHLDRRAATLARKHGEYFELLPEFLRVFARKDSLAFVFYVFLLF